MEIMSLSLNSPIFGLQNRWSAISPDFNEVFSTVTSPKRERAPIDDLVHKIQTIANSTLSEFEALPQIDKNKERAAKALQAKKVVTLLISSLIRKRDGIGGTSIFSCLIRIFKWRTIANYNALISKLNSAETNLIRQTAVLHNEYLSRNQRPDYTPPPMYDLKHDFIAKCLVRKFGFSNDSPLVALVKQSSLSLQDLITPTIADKDGVARILFSYLKEKYPAKVEQILIQETLFFAEDPRERMLTFARFQVIEQNLSSPTAPTLPLKFSRRVKEALSSIGEQFSRLVPKPDTTAPTRMSLEAFVAPRMSLEAFVQ